MKSLVTLFFIALLSSLSAQKTATPAQAPVEEAKKPADPFLASVSIARTSLIKLSEWIDTLDKEINAVQDANTTGQRASNLNLSKSNRQMKGAPIVQSRSNIKQMAGMLDDLEQRDSANRTAKLKALRRVASELDVSIQELYDSMPDRGDSDRTQAAELKTRHDTVKSSIANIR